ncbi:MAG TPA: ATP-binding cassette domain-containing protein, partial [Bacteroidales bacterium]|nr:ATP-binding cassette domain-containing protein [Bacteroidales bacterium]
MDIVLLDFYLRLFAIVANLFPHVLIENFKDFLKTSVLKDLNPELKLEGLKLFNEYYKQYEGASPAGNIQDLRSTVSQIDELIPGKQKFQILLRLLLFEKIFLKYSSASQEISFSDITDFITQDLNIDSSDYNDCRGFISGKYYQISDLKNLLIVSDNFSFPADFPFMYRKNFKGQLIFLCIRKYNIILFAYKGLQYITYNKQPVFASSIYFFNKGTSLSGEGFETIYYNQVYRKFKIHESVDLKMEVRDLEFRYNNSHHGIHKLSIDLEAEQLVGIIGRSGVGKSTLINLLIGNRKPTKGTITINGVDLNKDNNALDGLIGYVSQDDLLVEELSVFMNLLLNAQLCFGDLSKEELVEKVNNLLTDLDLYEVKDMQVGSALNRMISGGQRKKLNIALELIREPWILFADEPTSGLSSSDSEEIMQLFSEQTSKGKIVVVNIHQPSSDIFKLFDKIIVLDKEGYPVYFGSPLEAIAYFYDYYQMVSVNADICNVCENVNPETIFKILEDKKINQFGEFTKERKTCPEEWHRYFLSKSKVPGSQHEEKDLPKMHFNKPGKVKQFKIFGTRNLLTKLSNYQYILLTLLIAPALAVILSMLCRYNDINESASVYSFAFNENIPSYLFMSVIVALFLGLIMSAEEIIKDRKIIMRESYLKLNKLSYINSKTAFIFGVSALQLFLYVVIGDAILGIKGMNFSFWLILFSVSCFANLVGLVISSVLNSVIAVYILVPLIIVPQMLLSGVVVNYDKINKYVSSREFVPFVGDITAS